MQQSSCKHYQTAHQLVSPSNYPKHTLLAAPNCNHICKPPKTDKAVENIEAINKDSSKYLTPKVVFLKDTSHNKTNNEDDIKAIKIQRVRIQGEQTNIFSILPADQQHTPKPTPIKAPSRQHDQVLTKKTGEPKITYSITSSTTSQEYHSPPLSPEHEIPDLISEDLKDVIKTL